MKWKPNDTVTEALKAVFNGKSSFAYKAEYLEKSCKDFQWDLVVTAVFSLDWICFVLNIEHNVWLWSKTTQIWIAENFESRRVFDSLAQTCYICAEVIMEMFYDDNNILNLLCVLFFWLKILQNSNAFIQVWLCKRLV